MLKIVSILILLAILQHGLGCPFFDEAVKNGHADKAKYLDLYNQFHVLPDAYDSFFNFERGSPSPSNDQASVLIEFEYVVKNNGTCKKKTFSECVNQYAEEIPAENKTQPLSGACDANAKYAPIGGYCNNLENPNYGKVNTNYKRILNPVFSDGVFALRTAVSKQPLPNPRDIGTVLFESNYLNEIDDSHHDETYSLAALMFGQFVAHDISNRKQYLVKGGGAAGIRCCSEYNERPLDKASINPSCIPFPIASNDSFYGIKNISCINYIRMMPTLDNKGSVIYEPENTCSAFIDLTTIYSDTNSTLKSLRAFSGGEMQMDPQNILPLSPSKTLTGGDPRTGQTTQLALIHSLFYRVHNSVAQNLSKINPHWDEDKLFLESRRINTAIVQHIFYEKWLPLFIGKPISESRHLICKDKTNPCGSYDKKVDPSPLLEYAHSALRFFHTKVPSFVTFVNASGELVGEMTLSDTMSNPDVLKTKYDDLLRGIIQQNISNNVGYTQELTNLLFKGIYRGEQVGSDLFSVDIMRSRDAGTAPYVDYYDFCFSEKITHWHHLRPHFKSSHIDLLQTIYDDVRDVDLLVGLILEKHPKNGIGALGSCILAEQFHRLKFGDRFFYSHPTNPHPFTPEQLNEITNVTLEKIICWVTDVQKVPRDAFKVSSFDDYIDCTEFKPFNYELFREIPV